MTANWSPSPSCTTEAIFSLSFSITERDNTAKSNPRMFRPCLQPGKSSAWLADAPRRLRLPGYPARGAVPGSTSVLTVPPTGGRSGENQEAPPSPLTKRGLLGIRCGRVQNLHPSARHCARTALCSASSSNSNRIRIRKMSCALTRATPCSSATKSQDAAPLPLVVASQRHNKSWVPSTHGIFS